MTSSPQLGPLHQPDARLLMTLLDAIPARVAIIGADLRYLYGNCSLLEFFGLRAEDLVGMTPAELGGADYDIKVRRSATSALTGETTRWEGWITYHSSTERYVELILTPYRVGDGPPEGLFALTRDFTELKQAERSLAKRVEELHSSAALNSALIASALDCVIAIDAEGCIVEFNPAAEATFGYRRDEAMGRPIAELIIPPAVRARHTAGLARYLETGGGTILGRRIEVEAMHADGSLFPIELAVAEVRQSKNRLFTAAIRDLTAARTAAAEIERQREAIHQQDKLVAIGSLLAGIAHELNNPLAIVMGHSQMLQETGATPEIKERATKIRSAAERCARTVRTFLNIARQGKSEQRLVRLEEIVDAALDLIAYGLKSSGIDVSKDIPPDLPPVFGDSDQLHQVMLNLLVNAQQALEDTPQPRRICVTAKLVDPSAREISLKVKDNGPGVPADIAPRIFDPFFTTKPMGSGTGIGLAVCRGTIEAHGGSLRLADPHDGGACFEIRIPVATGATPPNRERQRGGTSAASLANVLIVDDEKELCDILSEILTRAGFNCDFAKSGRVAQSMIMAHNYDAIVSDIRMPDVDGPALFRWIEAERPQLASRVIFLTGDMLGPAAVRFLAECGRPVIEKPFVPEDVCRAIAAVTSRQNG
jgi:two-component system NtrC family sensor kinase